MHVEGGLMDADLAALLWLQTAPELSFATAAGLFTLLVGKPLSPHTAVAAACSLKGSLTGNPMDDQMLLAAKRNGIQHIILHRYYCHIHRLTAVFFLWRRPKL
jgi:hypothetical protein